MAGERDFRASPERGAVDRSDHGHWGVFNKAENLVIAGLGNPRVEFLDVRTSDKGPAGAGEHDRLNVRFCP